MRISDWSSDVCSSDLNDGDYADKPETRPDDWGKQVCKPDTRLATPDEARIAVSADEGGMQQQRHPGLGEEVVKPEEPEQADLPNLLDDEPDNAADKTKLERASAPSRAYGVNEAMGPPRDLPEGCGARTLKLCTVGVSKGNHNFQR